MYMLIYWAKHPQRPLCSMFSAPVPPCFFLFTIVYYDLHILEPLKFRKLGTHRQSLPFFGHLNVGLDPY